MNALCGEVIRKWDVREDVILRADYIIIVRATNRVEARFRELPKKKFCGVIYLPFIASA